MSKPRIAILVLLTALFIGALYWINTTVFAQVPDVVEFHYTNPNIERLLPEETTKINSSEAIIVATSAFKKAVISTLSGKNTSVIAVYTDKYYKELYPINMLRGNFLIAENGVAISDALAKQLFLTDDAVGYEMRVGEKHYTITGVYQADNSFMAESSGPSRVFLPIQPDMGVDMVSFEGSRFAAYYRSLFPKGTAYKFSGYTDINVLNEANIIKLLNLALLLIFGILVLAKLLHKCYDYFKQFYSIMRTNLEVSYFKTALFHSMKPLLRFLLPVVLSLAIIAICMLAVAQPLKLPIEIVTQNIFNLPAYYHIITSKLALPTTFIATYGAYHIVYAQIAMVLYLLATLIFLTLLIPALIYSSKDNQGVF